MEQYIRVIFAFILSMLLISSWQYFFPPIKPAEQTMKNHNDSQQDLQKEIKVENEELVNKDTILSESHSNRITIDNGYIVGSINLLGAVIDDVELMRYKNTVKTDSPNVTLLSPPKTLNPYYISFNWNNIGTEQQLPDKNTLWKSNKRSLGANEEVDLSWTNKHGTKFIINISIDDKYMFSIKHSIANSDIKTRVTSTISRSFEKKPINNWILHEGPIALVDNQIKELDYDDILKKDIAYRTNVSWLGFSDKYWLVSIIPHNKNYKAEVISNKQDFKTLVTSDGASSEILLFVGAKRLSILEDYSNKYHIPLFDRTVDFGVLYFITKPIFVLLNYFHHIIGNFGLAIMLLTVLIKIMLFPLASSGFRSMNKLKTLQPQMARIKVIYANNPHALQKAMINLYKKEKINPVSGCLPLILQMPIFFALYKVLYVTIEMRHAPFCLWVKDLSAPDPTSIFNLFGLINWQPPTFLMIGVLPILMAITMFLQQKFNPQSLDSTQANVMKFLPLVFLFIFSSFPSGLLLYWTWSNVLSIIQQLLIKKTTKNATNKR